MRFVNSLGLGDPPSIRTIHDRLAHYPGLGVKLDAEVAWTAQLMSDLAASKMVASIDFKGHYGFEVKDAEALAILYDHVLHAFPDALLEDPHDLPQRQAVADRRAESAARPLRAVRDAGRADVRRRHGGGGGRSRPDPAARFAVSPRCAQRRRPDGLRRCGPARRPAVEPAGAGPGASGFRRG